MTRASILGVTAIVTLLVGLVALGIVLSGQVGHILNLVSTESAAPPSAAPPSFVVASDAYNQDPGFSTNGYSGSNHSARSASSDAGISRPAEPTNRSIGTPEARSDNFQQTSVADPETDGPATGLSASGDAANAIGFAPQSNATSGTANAVGSSALPPTGANFAQSGTWAGATSGVLGAGSVGPFPASTRASSTPASSTPAIAATPAVVAALGPAAPVSAGTEPAITAAPIPPIADATNCVQTEGKTVVNDVLVCDSVDILGGRLGGSGTIQSASVTIGAGATLGPGNSPGTLTIEGDLVQDGELEIELESLSEFDILNVHGSVTFEPGSVLKFVPYNNYSPSSGDDFEFLTAYSISGNENLAFAIAGLPADFDYQVYKETHDGESDLYVRFYARADDTPSPEADEQVLYQGTESVPEPSTMALGVLGLALLGWRLRKRVA